MRPLPERFSALGERVLSGFSDGLGGDVEVLAYVDETDIGRISIRQQASFSVDTYPDAEFTAFHAG